MSPPSDEQFHGWLASAPTTHTTFSSLTWRAFTPPPFTPTSIDIHITHCGICGSDLHTLSSGWGPTHYPCCVGHEIVGTVSRIGAAVTRVQVGDRVGVGAQISSCHAVDCAECKAGLESYCPRMRGTYNAKLVLQDAAGKEQTHWSMGGYAEKLRVPDQDFVFKIPAQLRSEHAAPMLCGGITVYSPLKRFGAGPGKRVGIVGIGGLGHFGVLFARAMGCDGVVAISRSMRKKADAEALGADTFIATAEEKGWEKTHARSLDLLICTVSEANMPLKGYLSLLRAQGTFVMVGAPEDKIPGFHAFQVIGKGVRIAGSQIGSPAEIEEMLRFAAEKGVKPWVQVRKMREEGIAALEGMGKGDARYRYVLENEGVDGEVEKAKL